MMSATILPTGALVLLWLTVSATGAAATDPLEADPLVAIPGESPALSLDACVAEALQGNSDLARQRHHRQELRGQGWQAVSTALPSVDLVGNWNRSRDPSFLLDESFSGTSMSEPTSLSPEAAGILEELGPLFSFPDPDDLPAQSFWRASLSSEWELNPFRIVNSLSAVKVRLRQHEADLVAEQHRIAEETIRLFHEVSLHRERVAALDAEIQAREEFLDITRRRFRLELSTELDTLRAAVSVANLRPGSRRARKDLHNAAARLNLTMGREPLSPLTIVPVESVETAPVDRDEALQLAGERPDLRSLGLQVTFLRKRRGVERAEQRPSLSLGGSYGYVARSAGDLGDHDYWSASASLVVPLFDGLLTKGRVQEVEGTVAAAEEAERAARRRARLDVTTTLEEREAARESWEAATLTLEAADRALEQTTLRYELGQLGFLDVLNSQAQRFDARRNLIQARYDLLVETASLKRSLGSDPLLPLSRVREHRTGETR